MKVSIITACFNSSNEIKATYESIKSQTLSDWEWLVTDDCSKDNTMEILQKISQRDSRVRYFTNEVNSGAAVSRNNSISHARGEFLAFIDSDDLWLPQKLELQTKFMDKYSIDFSFTAYELVDVSGNQLGKTVDLNNCERVSYNDMLLKKATMGCSTVVLRRSKFSNLTMPLLRTGQDYATWLKLLKEVNYAVLLNKVLTSYMIRPDSISRNKFKKSLRQWEIYRNIEGLSFIKSLYCFVFYAFRAVFRK